MATDWLKKLRTEKFPSQTALALAAGIKPARYSRIEKGYCDMRDEEIEGLAKALKLTVDEVRNGQPGVEKPKVAKAEPPKGLSAARGAEAPPPKQPTLPPPSSPNPPMSPTETKPGDNLDDPKNFSLMPPTELLSHRDPNDADVRSQLQKATIFAEKVLHTSKVRPAVWVAWRDFGRDAQTFLRGPTPIVAPVEIAKVRAHPPDQAQDASPGDQGGSRNAGQAPLKSLQAHDDTQSQSKGGQVHPAFGHDAADGNQHVGGGRQRGEEKCNGEARQALSAPPGTDRGNA